MPSTEELVEAARAGETTAFGELVRRYERAAIITAHAVLGDFHLAQDAAQEAFIIAYRELEQLRDAATFGPWLLKIARRRSLRLQRGSSARLIDTECVDLARPQTNDWLQKYSDVVQQFARLPEHERIVTVMRYVDGRSVRDIADSTGRPTGTITKQLSRAIQRLRKWLDRVQS